MIRHICDTAIEIGPEDAGRPLALPEWERARETPGYVYELIEGIIEVSPIPTPLHDHWVELLRIELERYRAGHPGVIGKISERCEVAVPSERGPTRPQPDLAVYCGFPKPPPIRWDNVCPTIVIEVISDRRVAKDVSRNRELYFRTEGIAEYWIIDPREEPMAPSLIVLRREPGADSWLEHAVAFGDSFSTSSLPGLTLDLSAMSGW